MLGSIRSINCSTGLCRMRNTEKSKLLFERARRLFPGGVNSPVRAFKSVGSDPFMVQRGEGAYLVDVDGNRYVDYINSWGPLVLGHAHPTVLEALERQARLGTSYGACTEIEADLAELIMRFYPAAEMIRFVNSGTEAGMGVIRLARAATKRRKLLKFSGCYHGHADSFLVQAGSGVATLGLPNSPGVTETVAQDTLTAASINAPISVSSSAASTRRCALASSSVTGFVAGATVRTGAIITQPARWQRGP